MSGHCPMSADVRFTSKSGHWNSAARCPLCAKSGHRAGGPKDPPASPTSGLLARVSHSIPDLLCDLIQVPALRALKGRKLFVALELLEPQQLAEGQHVPVVYESCNRPGERTR